MLCLMLEWDRTYRTQGQYTLWSVLDPDRTSMKPRVIACSGWCSHIPRINVCSVQGQGLTLQRSPVIAGACRCWSQTEHRTPGLLGPATAGQCTYETRVFAHSHQCWSHIVHGMSRRSSSCMVCGKGLNSSLCMWPWGCPREDVEK